MAKPKQRMSLNDAMDLAPDDLPDGAFFAMAHELAGLDYGDGFDDMVMEHLDERDDDVLRAPKAAHPKVKCPACGKKLKGIGGYHAHWRMRHEGAPPYVFYPSGRSRKAEKRRQRQQWARFGRSAETPR